jgi:hypothetical protein
MPVMTWLFLALANLEILNQKAEKYAIAFTGNKGSLIKRIMRMMNQQSTKYTFKEGFIGTCVLFACLFIMAFSSNAFINIDKHQKTNSLTNFIPSVEKNDANSKFDKKNAINGLEAKVISAFQNKNAPVIDDTIVTINQGKEVLYSVNKTYYKIDLDNERTIQHFFVNGKEIPERYWKDYDRPIKEAMVYLEEYYLNMEKRDNEKIVEDEKKQIIDELVEDMKKFGLIDKNAISYKVHFYDSYLIIDDEKQANEVFEKYKKMFDEKAKGKYELDVKLNVNPNFYKKSPEEIQKIQEDAVKKQQEAILKEQVKMIKEQEEIIKKQQEELKEQKELLKNKEKENGIREEQLKKREEELRKREDELRKRNDELQKHNDDLKNKAENTNRKAD